MKTIENVIQEKINDTIKSDVITDFIIEIIFESLEYNQFEPGELFDMIDQKEGLSSDIENEVLFEINNYNFIREFDYNYNLLLNQLNLNQYDISNNYIDSKKYYIDIDVYVNHLLSTVVEDRISRLINHDIINEIVELYYYSIIDTRNNDIDCHITTKNLELINEYISNEYPSNYEEFTRLYIGAYNNFTGGLLVDSELETPSNLNHILNTFSVKYFY
jgi:hypothetical protein